MKEALFITYANMVDILCVRFCINLKKTKSALALQLLYIHFFINRYDRLFLGLSPLSNRKRNWKISTLDYLNCVKNSLTNSLWIDFFVWEAAFRVSAKEERLRRTRQPSTRPNKSTSLRWPCSRCSNTAEPEYPWRSVVRRDWQLFRCH